MDRGDYSLRCSGGGENFRIVWREGSQSSTNRAPIDLLMHAFVTVPSNRLVSFSSRGVAKTPNIQIRDLRDPSVIIAAWRLAASCLPWCDSETIYTLSEDLQTIESRSLQTGELVESIPFAIARWVVRKDKRPRFASPIRHRVWKRMMLWTPRGEPPSPISRRVIR